MTESSSGARDPRPRYTRRFSAQSTKRCLMQAERSAAEVNGEAVSASVEQAAPFQIPQALDRIIEQTPAKDRDRIREAVRRLHEANDELWSAEDRVRVMSDAEAVSDAKRTIDRLNRERNRLIDRIDEGFTHLSMRQPAKPSTPLHTETIGSVIDRLSVLTLRERHAVDLARTTGHPVAADRLPAIRNQRAELARSVADLAADLEAGARRLPDGRKFKLYGASAQTVGRVTVSPNIDQVIALGGLSECGKSSSGEYLRHVDGTYRLKMSFLLDVAAKNEGIADPYVLDRQSQAGLLLQGLNLFADMHVEARRFTIESVHSDQLIVALKRMLGDRLRIVYLDAPAHLRAVRSNTSRAALRAKDQVKVSRGAEQVAASADHRIDNSGSIVSLNARLRMIANTSSSQIVRVEPASESYLPPAIAGAVDQFAETLGSTAGVNLVALTGSSVDGLWLEGWSDIDLLVSADHDVHPAVARETSSLHTRIESVAKTNCAVTTVTPGEVSALLVQPRVVYALARLVAGRGSALYAAPGLTLPMINGHQFRHASTQDLPLVIVTLRRLLASAGSPGVDLRPLYKHIVLALRLMLRVSGIDVTGADAIADAAEEGLIGLGSLGLPPVAALAHARAHSNGTQHIDAVLQAARTILTWYADQVRTDVATLGGAQSGGGN